MVITLTNDNFEQEVLKAKGKVLVDFWADWCGPCKMLSPLVDEIAGEMDGKIKVGKLNVDEARLIASRYGVMSIPTLILFENGEIVNQSVGFINKQQIAAFVN
jgi:thioredoxin 1